MATNEDEELLEAIKLTSQIIKETSVSIEKIQDRISKNNAFLHELRSRRLAASTILSALSPPE